ncbi:UV-endonuclease UvdE [Polyplosphaeria fusca]|uniref:UV-endonuclease UvdE n=1 Tax=Polyplosphaeria fusca TaxID=682080 RepID=A0A9P4V9X5_9PLEO|nr:UV-endonuclease UvdE [Polyplosphaeria fusca]
MAKRKRSTAAVSESSSIPDIPPRRRTEVPPPANVARRHPPRGAISANPNANPDILDGIDALRASPDGGEDAQALKPRRVKARKTGSKVDTPTVDAAYASTEARAGTSAAITQESLSGLGGGAERHPIANSTDAPDLPQPSKNKRRETASQHVKVEPTESEATANARDSGLVGVTGDPNLDEGPDGENDDDAEVQEASTRPPPVNSDYLPLPWKGRLGYACLNTYLRNANPPVFSSRTCRIASILEHRHPLKDPSQPEHATKNRPDKDQPADVARGQRYVEALGLANARDIIKMVRWNDKFGIKFMRLSSEMFPFASHDEYGYKLAPFAADTLEGVGKVIAELGHRVTTHPGQFTQLGSPRKQVIDAAIRDLEFHDELLSLLKLPPQQDRDAVMILHLGGAFGDKPAAIDRFRENYAGLSQSIKNRLVLENDDVVWSLHELLPLCQELNIPFVLDFHHHNIKFDASQIREGTKDVVELFPQIIETWTRKGITPKMHYSESCPDAVTARSRRKHSPRVMTLPPCPTNMDLMIEAKDKEQAVFELMRTFKLPGFHLCNDIIPHVRQDENQPIRKKAAKKSKKKKTGELDDIDAKIEEAEGDDHVLPLVPEEEIGMGGPEGRVYWPPGMEEWLRPPKRVVKKKEEGVAIPAKKKRKAPATVDDSVNGVNEVKPPAKKAAVKRAATSAKEKAPKTVPTPEPSDDGDSSPLGDFGDDDEEDAVPVGKRGAPPIAPTRKRSGRVGRMSYKEEADEMSI